MLGGCIDAGQASSPVMQCLVTACSCCWCGGPGLMSSVLTRWCAWTEDICLLLCLSCQVHTPKCAWIAKFTYSLHAASTRLSLLPQRTVVQRR